MIVHSRQDLERWFSKPHHRISAEIARNARSIAKNRPISPQKAEDRVRLRKYHAQARAVDAERMAAAREEPTGYAALRISNENADRAFAEARFTPAKMAGRTAGECAKMQTAYRQLMGQYRFEAGDIRDAASAAAVRAVARHSRPGRSADEIVRAAYEWKDFR